MNSVTHTYTTLSGLVMQQTDGTQELYFLYDDSNQPYALVYKSSATAEPLFYYYLLNVQGDVVALMNTSGTIVARYSYDPWGVPTVMNSSGTVMEQSTFIGNINPLRYRGYYYDTETGFYYLQSRYYDPAIGRFISADTFATTDCNGFLSANMFAYCENNPVNNSDPNGEFLATAIGAAVGAATGAIFALIAGENVKAAAVSGAISGAVAGLATDIMMVTGGTAAAVVGVYAAAGALGSAAGSVAAQRIEGKSLNWSEVGKEALVGGVFGALGGLTTGSITPMMTKVTQSAGKKAIRRGITKQYAIKKTIRGELRRSGRSVAENAIGNFNAWYTRLRIKNLFRR